MVCKKKEKHNVEYDNSILALIMNQNIKVVFHVKPLLFGNKGGIDRCQRDQRLFCIRI